MAGRMHLVLLLFLVMVVVFLCLCLCVRVCVCSCVRVCVLPSTSCPQDDVTLTGAISGDIYQWKSNVLTRVIAQAHSGPVFAMYTCLEDGLVISAGKERRWAAWTIV